MVLSCIDGISDTVAGMRTATDPFAANAESLATSGAGELERLRYQLANVLGWAYWYSNDTNINFAHAGGKTNVQGAGTGRHVTAVGYHSWAGSARFPAITGRYGHTTGFFWPAAHHLAVAVDPGVERDKGGVEVLRLHFTALQLHHTVALRYAHSQSGLASWQYPHITAVSLTQAQRGPDGAQPPAPVTGYDQLIFGHAGTVMQLVGYGASHIALGSRAYLALGTHAGAFTPVSNALYADTIPKAWVTFVTTANAPIDNSFNVASVVRVDTGHYIVTWDRDFAVATYVLIGNASGAGGFAVTIESRQTTHAVVRAWSGLGTPGTPVDPGDIYLAAFGRQ